MMKFQESQDAGDYSSASFSKPSMNMKSNKDKHQRFINNQDGRDSFNKEYITKYFVSDQNVNLKVLSNDEDQIQSHKQSGIFKSIDNQNDIKTKDA